MQKIQWEMSVLLIVVSLSGLLLPDPSATSPSAPLLIAILCGIVLLPPVSNRLPIPEWLTWAVGIGGLLAIMLTHPFIHKLLFTIQ